MSQVYFSRYCIQLNIIIIMFNSPASLIRARRTTKRTPPRKSVRKGETLFYIQKNANTVSGEEVKPFSVEATTTTTATTAETSEDSAKKPETGTSHGDRR